jgi:RNA polymerase sigma factor (sigma-70 family)
MTERTDQHLLQLWATGTDEMAFREFAARYAGFVFGTARRRVGDVSLAEEITQDVFATVARQAARLRSHPSIAAWLHRTAMLTALDRLRRRARQERKVEDLKAMQSRTSERDPWVEVLPRLDEALDRLRGPDRDLLMLHFAEGLTFPKVAARLGTSPDAARMRTTRALESLSQLLRSAGVTIPAAMLAAGLGSTFAEAAPVTLTLTPTALAGAGKVSASTAIMHALQGMKALHISSAALATIVVASVIFFQQKEIQAVEDRIAKLHASMRSHPLPSEAIRDSGAPGRFAAASTQALDLRQLSIDALLGSYAGKNRISAVLARLDDNNLAGLLETTLHGSLLPEPRRSLISEILTEMERRSPAQYLQASLGVMRNTTSADFFRDLSTTAQASVQAWISKNPDAASTWARENDAAWQEAHRRYNTWRDSSLLTRIVAGLLARDPERGYAMLEEMKPAAIRSVLQSAANSLPPGRLQTIAEWGSQRSDVEKRRRIVRTSVGFLSRNREPDATPFSVAAPILEKLSLSDEDRAWIAARVAVDTIFDIERDPDKPPQAEAAAWLENHLPAELAMRAKGAVAHMLQPSAALIFLNRQLDAAPNDDLIAGYVESADLAWHGEFMKSAESKDGRHGDTAFRLATRVEDPDRRFGLLARAWEDLHKDAPSAAREILNKVGLTTEDRAALEERFAGQLQTAR